MTPDKHNIYAMVFGFIATAALLLSQPGIFVVAIGISMGHFKRGQNA